MGNDNNHGPPRPRHLIVVKSRGVRTKQVVFGSTTTPIFRNVRRTIGFGRHTRKVNTTRNRRTKDDLLSTNDSAVDITTTTFNTNTMINRVGNRNVG